MDINKGKLVYIKDKSQYNSNNFLDTQVIFVEDTKEIITHGISFAGIPSSYSMYMQELKIKKLMLLQQMEILILNYIKILL